MLTGLEETVSRAMWIPAVPANSIPCGPPMTSAAERFRSLHRLVGNTPLLAVDFTWRGEPRVIYAKQESLNLTGSIKDRMALYILEHGLSGRPDPAGRSDRRGDQRQYRHFVCGHRARARPPGDGVHAGLDESASACP